jgi:hypothetical protein
MTQSASARKRLVCQDCWLTKRRSTHGSPALTSKHSTNRANVKSDMALRALKTCNKSGCPTLIKDGRYCAKHGEQAKQREYAERNADEIRKLYATRRWMRVRNHALYRNQPCQRLLEDGKRCEHGATIAHHIVSPRENPDLMYDTANLLCVCAAHHPNTEGEEDLTRYAPTITD